MALTLVKYPSPKLRMKSLPLTEEQYEGPDFKWLVDKMIQLAISHSAAGLAAPQVGILQRFFIWYTDGKWEVVINPEILSFGLGKSSGPESCLSIPGINLSVTRPAQVVLRSYDPEGTLHDREFIGFSARVVQHEIDHLDGILFIDHASASVRKVAMRRYRGL